MAAARAEVDAPDASPANRRRALYFTVYQLLRVTTFPFLGQYLTAAVPSAGAADAQASLNRAIAALRCPHFSDWIDLARTLRKHGAALGLDVLPQFPAAMDAADALLVDMLPEYSREVGLRGVRALDAFRGLRNGVDHAGLSSSESCLRAVAYYTPWLDRLLESFAFLCACDLLVLRSEGVQLMRGPDPDAPQPTEQDPEIRRAFERSPVVVRVPDGRIVPVFPFLHGQLHGEPIAGYDGHDFRGGSRGALARTVYYLGNGDRIPVSEAPEVDQLQRLLEARDVRVELSRNDVRAWTVAEAMNEYSQRVLADLRGTKYLPQCFLERPELGEPVRHLLMGSPERSNARTRGVVLAGAAGSGKTALVCHWANELLADPAAPMVLLLRGDSILPRRGNVLYQDVAHKVGLRAKDFSSFRELFSHLAKSRSQDRQHPDRRLVLLLDALNEAPHAEQVFSEAMDLVRDAREFNWVRVVVTVRDEYLRLAAHKRGDGERDPLDGMHELLLRPPIDTRGDDGRPAPPVWLVPALTLGEARRMYETYRDAGARGEIRGGASSDWGALTPAQQQVLTNPLHIHLWMITFADRSPGALAAAGQLMEAFLDEACARRAHLWPALRDIADRMIERGRCDLDDSDAIALRDAWEHERGLEAEDRRFRLSPIELACADGILHKRITAEGGGYVIPVQLLRERLLRRRLKEIEPTPSEPRLAEWARSARFPEMVEALALVAEDSWKTGRSAELAALLSEEPGAQALTLGVTRAAASELSALEHTHAATQLLERVSPATRVAACRALVDATEWAEGVATSDVCAALANAAVDTLRPINGNRVARLLLARALLALVEQAAPDPGEVGAFTPLVEEAVSAARSTRRGPWARLSRHHDHVERDRVLRRALELLADAHRSAGEWPTAVRALRDARQLVANGSHERIELELDLADLQLEAGDERAAHHQMGRASRLLFRQWKAMGGSVYRHPELSDVVQALDLATSMASIADLQLRISYSPTRWEDFFEITPWSWDRWRFLNFTIKRQLLDFLPRLVALDPEDGELRFRIARSLLWLRDWMMAEETAIAVRYTGAAKAREGEERLAQSRTDSDLRTVDDHLTIVARVSDRLGARAHELLEDLHRKNPWHRDLGLAYADLVLERSEPKGAAILEQLHEDDPGNLEIGVRLANALLGASWLPEAERSAARGRGRELLERLHRAHPMSNLPVTPLIPLLAREQESIGRLLELLRRFRPPERLDRRSCQFLAQHTCLDAFDHASPSDRLQVCDLAIAYATRSDARAKWRTLSTKWSKLLELTLSMVQRASTPADERRLRIGVFEDSKIVEERVIEPDEEVLLVDGEVRICALGSSFDGIRIFVRDGSTLRFNFTSSMVGRLTPANGQSQALDEVARSGVAIRQPGGIFSVALDATARGKLDLSGRTLLFQVIRASPAGTSRPHS